MTLTRATMFRFLREFADKRLPFIGELLHCPYCTSHWLALGAVMVYRPRLVDSGFLPIDLVVSGFVMVTLASFACGLIHRAFSFHADE